MSDLQILWFTLIAVLWVGYFFLEGFDFGVGILLPFLGKDDVDRRVLINTIGPVWDGNEVWLVVAGGATFAAFPDWYATLFSGFYLPLFLVLVALIFRGVAFESRSKDLRPAWRAWWDRAIFFGSLIPSLLWGVAWANILRGVPINSSKEFTGSFFGLLNPYALVGGLAFVLLFTLHGAVFIALKTHGEIAERARSVAAKLSWGAAVAVFGFLGWTYLNAVEKNTRGIVPDPLPIAAIVLLVTVSWLVYLKLDGWAFVATGASIMLLTATVFMNLYPRVMVSSTNPDFSLTIASASSAPYTLKLMSIVAAIFTPLVLAYQAWTYWVFRRRIGREDLAGASESAH